MRSNKPPPEVPETRLDPAYLMAGAVSQYTRQISMAGGRTSHGYRLQIERDQKAAAQLLPEIKQQLDRLQARSNAGTPEFKKRCAPAIKEKVAFCKKLAEELRDGMDVD
jgi:hypothetical protein